MSSLTTTQNNHLLPVEPRVDFIIRKATLDDFGWIDAMQKAESDKLGFLMKVAIEKRIEQGNILVAIATADSAEGTGNSATPAASAECGGNSALSEAHCSLFTSHCGASPLGYCIAVDRYMKQDHVGQFIQLNVLPGSRRGLIGAALVKATFEKSAYGVKLYGLWCRQDLSANYFWQSLGFVPLAFRAAGISNQKSGKAGKAENEEQARKRRVHIYWQRRVREGDHETAHWFPYETSGGMMAESRLVLPIPLGTGWEDAKPAVLPGAERRAQEARLLEADHDTKAEADKAALAAKRKEARQAAKEAKRIAESPKTVHGVEIASGGADGV